VLVTDINATTHAVERWRERVALYGDEDGRDLLAAFRESRLVEMDEPCPFARSKGSRYYFHEKIKCWFIVDPTDGTCEKIVSVVMPSDGVRHKPPALVIEPCRTQFADAVEEHEYLQERIHYLSKLEHCPGSAAEKNAVIAEKRRVLSQLRQVKPVARRLRRERAKTDGTATTANQLEPRRQDFEDIEQERIYLVTRQQELVVLLHATDSASKSVAIQWQITDTIARLKEIRPEFMKIKAARHLRAELSGELYRDDGGVNYGVAIRTLLERVAALETRVAELEKRN
jgi:hypothetical protein